MQSQIYWVLPIAIGYAKTKGIKEIILEKNYKVNIKNKVKISFTSKIYYLSKIKFWIFFIKNLFLFSYVYIRLDYKCANKKFNNIFHSILDYARVISSDNDVKIKIANLIRAIIYCTYKYSQAYILRNQKVNVVILGHSVYGSRAQLAYFREHNINIFCQSSFVIYNNSNKVDNSWNTPDLHFFNKIMNKTKTEEVKNYWEKRKKGKSSYIDATDAFNGKKFSKSDNFNLIMLHIFRDSPFSVIDNKRIFIDYYHWVIETLKIIKKSNEKWIIRIHPSGNRWGESSSLILKNIIKKNNLILGNNIVIDQNEYSNFDLIEKAKKIITYSGTTHLEAASFGKKVIVISEVMLSKYFPECIFKPTSVKEYSNLVLSNEPKKFILNPKQAELAKKLLFIRENLLTLKEDLNGIKIYRNDKKSLFEKEEKISLINSLKLEKELLQIGSQLVSNFPQTTKVSLMKKLTI